MPRTFGFSSIEMGALGSFEQRNDIFLQDFRRQPCLLRGVGEGTRRTWEEVSVLKSVAGGVLGGKKRAREHFFLFVTQRF